MTDMKGAIQDYTEDIRLDPKDSWAYERRGSARSFLGDRKGAIADFEKAIQLDPNCAWAYYGLGNARRGGQTERQPSQLLARLSLLIQTMS